MAVSYARGDERKNALDEHFFVTGIEGVEEGGNEGKAHAAVNVVANAARADNAHFRIHSRDASDGEPISPVNVGHGDAITHNARKVGDIADLFEGFLDVHVIEEFL